MSVEELDIEVIEIEELPDLDSDFPYFDQSAL